MTQTRLNFQEAWLPLNLFQHSIKRISLKVSLQTLKFHQYLFCSKLEIYLSARNLSIKELNVSGLPNKQCQNAGIDAKSDENTKLKNTESMTGYYQKPVQLLSDTQSMAEFILCDNLKNIDNTGCNKYSNKPITESNKSLEDTVSMSQYSFVSTRPRKKYDRTYNDLPDTESMTNFSGLSQCGSISPKSIANNQNISLINFTLSDKLSSGLKDHTLCNKPLAPFVIEDSFSINGSHLQKTDSANSSKLSNSVVPEESLTVSETSSDNDQNVLSGSPPKKPEILRTDDDSESNEEQVSITAKFNIKIQLSGIIAESIKEVQGNIVSTDKVHKRQKSNDPSISDSLKEGDLQDLQEASLNISHKKSPERSLKAFADTPKQIRSHQEGQSDFDESEFDNNVKLLTKLYGNEWKTPVVKEILISQSTKKKKLKPRNDAQNIPTHHNQSIGDFSNCKYLF